MNASKKINVNFSSLVGLKAELLRKQTEVKEAKAHVETIQTPRLKRKSKSSKRDTEKKTEELLDIDDINAHKKSKLVLEAKTRLYERMKKSRNNNDHFLVDFANKSDESDVNDFSKEEEEEETSLYKDDNDYDNDEFLDPENTWVEYEDCFGRTRKCLKKDLHLMQQKDQLLQQQISKKRDDQESDDAERKTDTMKEPEIDIMRRKWEEQTRKLADKIDIHYQDILFDEARSHGVGYYAFSQDEEQRVKQQENLAKLRKDTEQKQKEAKELRELKERMERNRLKAARIRQRIRAGLPAEPEEQGENEKQSVPNVTVENNSSNSTSINSMPKESTEKSKQDNTIEDKAKTKEDKIKAFGELLGKGNVWREMSQEEWVEKMRQKRTAEFAPVYNNFEKGEVVEGSLKKNTIELNDKEETVEHDNFITEDNSSIEQENIQNKMTSDQVNYSYYTPAQMQPSNVSVNSSLITYPHIDYYGKNGPIITEQKNFVNLPVQEESESIEDNENQTIQSTQVPSNRNINAESIAAGLRYLREKYEESQNH